MIKSITKFQTINSLSKGLTKASEYGVKIDTKRRNLLYKSYGDLQSDEVIPKDFEFVIWVNSEGSLLAENVIEIEHFLVL